MAKELKTKNVPMLELKVGDRIKVWWKGDGSTPNTDIITRLVPYRGPLKCIAGAKLADFQFMRAGMTLEPDSDYELVIEDEPEYPPGERYSPHPLDNLGDR